MAPPFRDNRRGKGIVLDWARILAYVTGTVDQELLARSEYLAAENRILKSQLNGRLELSDAARAMLGKIGHRLGRQALAGHHDSPGRAVDAADCHVTVEGCGALRDCRYLLHDRDTKYTQSFRAIIVSGRVEPLVLPARSPNLNAYADRWVRSVKEECL
jgi:hypothetical protein